MAIKSSLLARAVVVVISCLPLPALAGQRLVLDSGHDPLIDGVPKGSGSLGTCGQAEVVYNDQAVKRLQQEFAADHHYQLILTRKEGAAVDTTLVSAADLKTYLSPEAQVKWQTKPTILGRALIANASHCDAFVSIHHDSTVDAHQITDPGLCPDPTLGHPRGGKRLSDDFKSRYKIGYSVFTYDKDQQNPMRSLASRRLAIFIARRIQALGRTASNYHLPEPDQDCRTCEFLDERLGIMHQNIAVLRETRCPAVLVEVGNIVDPDDERTVNNDEFRARLAQAIKAGVDEYFKSPEQAGGKTQHDTKKDGNP